MFHLHWLEKFFVNLYRCVCSVACLFFINISVHSESITKAFSLLHDPKSWLGVSSRKLGKTFLSYSVLLPPFHGSQNYPHQIEVTQHLVPRSWRGRWGSRTRGGWWHKHISDDKTQTIGICGKTLGKTQADFQFSLCLRINGHWATTRTKIETNQ